MPEAYYNPVCEHSVENFCLGEGCGGPDWREGMCILHKDHVDPSSPHYDPFHRCFCQNVEEVEADA